jgi:hypothetical protein
MALRNPQLDDSVMTVVEDKREMIRNPQPSREFALFVVRPASSSRPFLPMQGVGKMVNHTTLRALDSNGHSTHMETETQIYERLFAPFFEQGLGAEAYCSTAQGTNPIGLPESVDVLKICADGSFLMIWRDAGWFGALDGQGIHVSHVVKAERSEAGTLLFREASGQEWMWRPLATTAEEAFFRDWNRLKLHRAPEVSRRRQMHIDDAMAKVEVLALQAAS